MKYIYKYIGEIHFICICFSYIVYIYTRFKNNTLVYIKMQVFFLVVFLFCFS